MYDDEEETEDEDDGCIFDFQRNFATTDTMASGS